MESKFHTYEVTREQTIVRFLARKLGANDLEEFENHYLSCEDCFEEIRAAELLISGLSLPPIESSRTGDVTVIRFTGSAELTCSSPDFSALAHMVDLRGDTKVLIDLRQVSRIDSAGLGLLMQCYTHSVRNAGALKLLHPAPQVKRVLSLTRIDSVVPTFEEEAAALQSFG